jgi:hypothetical protein
MVKFKFLPMIMAALASSASLAPAAGCNAKASQVWAASASRELRIEALADGPYCTVAVVLLVIRNSKGEPLWIESSKADDIFTFTQSNPTTVKAMTEALKEWIRKDDRLLQSGTLPDWKEGSDAAGASEFPFYVDEGVTRDEYLNIRKAELPMYCHVAGMESEACVVLKKDGTIAKVGSQSFPG